MAAALAGIHPSLLRVTIRDIRLFWVGFDDFPSCDATSGEASGGEQRPTSFVRGGRRRYWEVVRMPDLIE
jgi:hypothetical protein